MMGGSKYFCNMQEIEKAYLPKAVEKRETDSLQDRTDLGTHWAKITIDNAKQNLKEKLSGKLN